MVELYNDYAVTYSVTFVQSESSTGGQPIMQPVHFQSIIGMPQSRLKSQLKRQRTESDGGNSKQTMLQVYLSENIVEEFGDFDVLRWW